MKIGVLSFAHVHAAGYVSLLRGWAGVEVLCADPDRGDGGPNELRGVELAQLLGVDYVETYDELFAWGPDAVIVCSENAKHRDLVVRAAREKCPVLCEKPLATTVEDAEAMIAACDAQGVFLMMAYPVRFSPEFASLRAAAQSGLMGEVLMVTGTNNGKIPVGDRAWFTDPLLSGGGALVDHVVHVADLLDSMFNGQEAESVYAATNQILHAEKPQVKAETGGLVTIRYPHGVSATIDCSWSQPDHAPSWGGLTLRVIGTAGSGFIAPFHKRVDGFTEGGARPRPLYLGFGLDLDQVMLARFIDAVAAGKRHLASPPQPDGLVGLRTLRIVVAAQKSAESGMPVLLNELGR